MTMTDTRLVDATGAPSAERGRAFRYDSEGRRRLCVMTREPAIPLHVDLYFADREDPSLPALRYAPQPNTCATCGHRVDGRCMQPDGDGGYLCWEVDDGDFCSKWADAGDTYRSRTQALLMQALAEGGDAI